MSLQARLTLWSILLTAIVVGLVSFIDLTSEINRQFFSTQNDAELIRRLAEEFTRHSIDRSPGALSARAAVANNSPWLSAQLLSLMRVMKPVSDIAVCDSSGSGILADSHIAHIGQACPSAPVWSQVTERASWFDRMLLLWRDEKAYELSGEVSGIRATDPPLTVRVILQPRIIRLEMSEVLRRHFGISAVAVVVIMFVAFILSSVALQPLGRLGRMVDNIARGEFELSGDSGKREAQDEFNVVASKVNLLGQQLRGAKTEFSDLKTNVERLLEELEDAVLIFGRDRRLIAAAGAVERLLGTPKAALLNKTIADVFPAGTTLALFLAQALQTGRTIRNRRVPLSGSESGNGKPQFALLTVEFLDPGGPGGMLIRLRDPEATRAIGRRLQTADRLSAISSLTKGVAHEVKNPLNAILMHVELARYKLSHGDYDLEQQMDVISTEIIRLDRVVKTFLDFTRPVQLNVSEVKLREFMEEIAALARPQAEAAGIQIIEKTEVDDAVIAADVDLLKQAVLNIVVNAIEAMPNGGRMSLEAGFRGDDAEIRISDSGPGIPADVRERIYDLYFTTKQHGSGIGLAMTYRILQLHDGTIDFTSGPEQGDDILTTTAHVDDAGARMKAVRRTAERRARAVNAFVEAKLDAMLFTNLYNVRYLAGFTGSNGALLLYRDRQPVFFTDPRYAVQSSEEVDCNARVAKGPLMDLVMRELGKTRPKRLGVEQDEITFARAEYLKKKLPGRSELAGVSGLVENLRMVKDAEEIELIRASVELNSRALDRALGRFKAGMSERELAAELDYQSRKLGAEAPSFDTIVAAGARAALPHAHPGAATIGPGMLLIDMGAFRDGYASDMTRMAHVGAPPPKYKKAYKAVLEAQLAAIDAVRAGAASVAVDRAARRALKGHGLEKEFIHSTGHGLGLEIHEPPRLGRQDKTKLAAGMAVTIEPGVYIEGWGGIRIEDTVLVTDNGCEILTPTSKELRVI